MDAQYSNAQMKNVILGSQITLLFIMAYRLILLGDYTTSIVLGSLILLLQVIHISLKAKRVKLASDLFCLIIFCVIASYMWKYEGARDEVTYLLPSLVAFSLLTGTKKVSILLLFGMIAGILSLGYLSDINYRAQTISSNSLSSSVLIVTLMCFGVFLFWNLLNAKNKMLKQLKRTLATQHSILNNLGEALIISDSNGTIIQSSSSALTLLGIGREDSGEDNLYVMFPTIRNFYKKFDDEYEHDIQSISHQLCIENRDGKHLDIKLILTKKVIHDETIYIGLISDITDDLKSKDMLNKAIKQADEANLAKSEFLSNMSHEIRTPMNGVMGALQLLSRENIPQSSKKLVEMAKMSSSTLLTLINDILDFSKIEAGKLTLEKVDFNLTTLIEQLFVEVQALANDNKNKLLLCKVKTYQEGWQGDPVRVKQIILNLLSNSIKFTQQGSIEISLGVVTDNKLQITVKDMGIGMSPDVVQSLFERFTQADNSTTREYGGTGLGMSITQSLVTMMNGTIEVESEVNKGSIFTVTLPLKRVSLAEKSLNITESITIPNLAGVNILLAEDNKINQTIFLKIMGETNANLFVVNNGVEAVERASKNDIDIIFMDIQMPKMDGKEACKLIKKQQPFIPIIALTANVMTNDVKQYAIDGFDAHIGKPINFNELYRAANWHKP